MAQTTMHKIATPRPSRSFPLQVSSFQNRLGRRTLSPMRWIILLAVLTVGCSGSPTSPTPSTPPAVVVPPVVTPPVVVAPVVPVRNPLLDDPRFDLNFYRQFAHAGNLHSLSRWTRAPLVYIRTVDDRGQAVAPSLLTQTAAAIINTTGQWTGGSFGIAGLEQGTGTREGQPGWLTVAWSTSGVCGTTNGVVGEGSTIVMNHTRPECTCGPLVAKHELGHALGFNHTDSNADLMAATFQGVCDKPLSAREGFHAQVAYSLPSGSPAP